MQRFEQRDFKLSDGVINPCNVSQFVTSSCTLNLQLFFRSTH